MRMPWGKFRGEDLGDVPASYLAWAVEEATISRDLRTAIRDELARRFSLASPPPPGNESIPTALRPIAQELVKAGFRRLALVHHPDHGGSVDSMRLVLEASRALEVLLDGDRP